MKTTEEYEKEVKALRDQVENLMNAFEASLTELKEKEKPIEERIINLLEGIQKTLNDINRKTTEPYTINPTYPTFPTNPDPWVSPGPIIYSNNSDDRKENIPHFTVHSGGTVEDDCVLKNNKFTK